MKLEIGSFQVSGIVFGPETRLDGGVLMVNRDEIRKLVLEDSRISSADLELAEPGKSVRIVHVCDAIEPKVKIEGPGSCYPAASESVETVGKGVTHRLAGMSVVLSVEYPRFEDRSVPPVFEAILDMSGPGALSPLAGTLNLVLAMKLAPGYSAGDCHESVKRAGFKAAARLAATTLGKSAPVRTVYELRETAGKRLPRVVYIHQVLSQLNLAVPFATWYGNYITDWMPFWVHPNEILDGALLPSALGGYAVKPTSWEFVNNPVIDRLYRAHGVSIDFAGVILHRTRFETFKEKQLSSNQAVNLAKLIGADGAILTWVSAGNAFIEGMLTVQGLERESIKTVFMTYEHGGKAGREEPLMYLVPEANALVSVGSLDRPITLPPVQRVIGGTDLSIRAEASTERMPAAAEINLDWFLPLLSAVDHWGFGNQTCRAY